MSDSNGATVLTLPNSGEQPLSIRAKALVFSDPASQALLDHLERIAASDATVMIVGETGTGKELVARHVHHVSGRAGPFMAVNCGAFNENLVEAELFGHEAGAYTGAQQARQGWFEAANGGTLFLDEIGDMPLSLQVKLLRVLQERQVARVGSRKSIAIDVRLVVATNVDLERAMEAGHFRRDLFYRLNVAPVRLPPLRERRGDILPLAQYFVEIYRQKLKFEKIQITPVARQALLSYNWPGNIRELENIVHFAIIVCRDQEIREGDLRLPTLGYNLHTASTSADPITALRQALQRLVEGDQKDLYQIAERQLVTVALDHCNGNQVRTAKRLGISRNILRAQLKRFGLLKQSAWDETFDADFKSVSP